MKRFIIIALFLSFIAVSDVLAKGFNMSLTGDDEFDKNLTIELEIGDIEEYSGFYGLTATLNYDKEKLELIEIKGENEFNLTYGVSNNKIVLYNPYGISKKTSVIKMSFKNIGLQKNETTKIMFDNIVVSDGNKDIVETNISKTVKNIGEVGMISSENVISSLKINNHEIKLEDENLNYDVVVDYKTTKIEINAKTNDSKSKVIGNGKYKLDVGENSIDIVLESEDDTQKKYTINIYREQEGIDLSNEDENLVIVSKKNNKVYIVAILLIVTITVILCKKRILKIDKFIQKIKRSKK